MTRKHLLVLVVSVSLVAGASAGTVNAPKPTITAGDFAVKVANAIGKPSTSPATAIDSLREMGVRIGQANADLSEDEASIILGALGVRMTTGNPDGALAPGKAEQLVGFIALMGTAGVTLPGNNLPTQCLESYNRGVCENCCKSFYGCHEQGQNCDYASGCAKFCKAVLPPGKQSPSVPVD